MKMEAVFKISGGQDIVVPIILDNEKEETDWLHFTHGQIRAGMPLIFDLDEHTIVSIIPSYVYAVKLRSIPVSAPSTIDPYAYLESIHVESTQDYFYAE